MTIPSPSATSPRRSPSPNAQTSSTDPAPREPGVSLARPQDAPASPGRTAGATGPMAPRTTLRRASAATSTAAASPLATRSGTPAGSPAGSGRASQDVQELARQLHSAEVRKLEQLAKARDVLLEGGDAAAARAQTGLDRTVIGNHFDDQGHLLVSQAVERTLKGRAARQIEQLAALPRALRPVDMNLLAQVLKDNPGATDGQLRDAARRAEVSRAAITYLFAAGTPLHDRLRTLPQAQQAVLVEAHAPPETPAAQTPAAASPAAAQPQTPASMPASTPASTRASTPASTPATAPTQAAARPRVLDPLHRRHLQESRRFEQVATAHLLIQQGLGVHATANRSGLPAELVASAFSNDGRLLLNAAGAGVAQTADEATARRFAALPRALEAADVARLAELLHVLPAAAGPLLRESSLRVGVSPEAVAHLFDAGVPMHERLATLPDHQREALEAAMAASPAPVPEPSQGSPVSAPGEVPLQPDAGLSQAQREFLEQHLFGDSDSGSSPAPTPRRSPTPEELSDNEIAWLRQTLGMSPQAMEMEPARMASPHSSGAVPSEPAHPEQAPQLSTSSRPASPAPSAAAEGLSQEMLAFVGEFLRKETEHARDFAKARGLLAGGATMAQAARAIGAHASTLGNSFSEEGHLLVTKAAERLLQARNPANAAPFATLPRALTNSDLAQLGRVFRENPGASEDELHSAAMRAKVSQRAIAHLFDTGEPLRARLATLPPRQQRSLGIDVPDEPPRPVATSPQAAPGTHAASTSAPLPRLAEAPQPEPPAPWELPAQDDDDMDDLVARLSFSPVASPTGQLPTVQSPVAQSPSFGGLLDPGTPPWGHLDEPMSPNDALAFDVPSTSVSPPRQTPAAQEARTPEPRPDTPPAAAERTGPATTSPWGVSRPRTNPARPARDFGAVPRDAVASSSAGPSSAPKRPGEDLQGPAPTRQRREEPVLARERPPQDLQWGRQAPRSRPAPPQEQPLPDLRWGRQAQRTGRAPRQASSSDSSSD